MNVIKVFKSFFQNLVYFEIFHILFLNIELYSEENNFIIFNQLINKIK